MIFDMPTCGGCRTCEVMCSFHHLGIFRPIVSSIKIIDKENEPGFSVRLVEKNDTINFACDGCKGLDIPLCLEVCKDREELEKMINDYLKKTPSPGERKG